MSLKISEDEVTLVIQFEKKAIQVIKVVMLLLSLVMLIELNFISKWTLLNRLSPSAELDQMKSDDGFLVNALEEIIKVQESLSSPRSNDILEKLEQENRDDEEN